MLFRDSLPSNNKVSAFSLFTYSVIGSYWYLCPKNKDNASLHPGMRFNRSKKDHLESIHLYSCHESSTLKSIDQRQLLYLN